MTAAAVVAAIGWTVTTRAGSTDRADGADGGPSPRSILSAGPTVAVTPPAPSAPSATPARKPAPRPLPEVWVGSSVDGVYPLGVPDGPAVHPLTDTDAHHDFAFDTAARAGSAVRVYVAPQTPGYTVTTRVERIGVLCGSADRGGSSVTVGVYADSTRIGSVVYGHIVPTVRAGELVDRYGGQLGTVRGGLPVDEDCSSGEQVRTELRTVGPYASCWNHYGRRQGIHPSNFVGFVGGARATTARQRCP